MRECHASLAYGGAHWRVGKIGEKTALGGRKAHVGGACAAGWVDARRRGLASGIIPRNAADLGKAWCCRFARLVLAWNAMPGHLKLLTARRRFPPKRTASCRDGRLVSQPLACGAAVRQELWCCSRPPTAWRGQQQAEGQPCRTAAAEATAAPAGLGGVYCPAHVLFCAASHVPELPLGRKLVVCCQARPTSCCIGTNAPSCTVLIAHMRSLCISRLALAGGDACIMFQAPATP